MLFRHAIYYFLTEIYKLHISFFVLFYCSYLMSSLLRFMNRKIFLILVENILFWQLNWITFIFLLKALWTSMSENTVTVWIRSTIGQHYREERWELNCSPPPHHKLSSHCLGSSPGAGVIAAVWHCGECFAFLLSQGYFPSLTLQPATETETVLFPTWLLYNKAMCVCQEQNNMKYGTKKVWDSSCNQSINQTLFM